MAEAHRHRRPVASLTPDPRSYPVDSIIEDVRRALARERVAVLQAPPASGKTTRVPLWLLDEPWLAGRKILLLEPRRLAARMAARWMASSLGEDVGGAVGYRIRMDSRVTERTRVEVVTEGILTRMIQDDPSLERVGLVIFDEFHERSLQADLGLALALDARRTLREDLRVLVMSATLDVDRVMSMLGRDRAQVISCEGKAFPVDTRYADRPATSRLDERVSRAVLRALREETGSCLVFLPGASEIRWTEKLLKDADLPESVSIVPLLGALSREEQDRAVEPARPGKRKVVLATSIAESSITIQGIRVVVDAGKMRLPAFSPQTGMTRLVTIPVSRASADQRRGRAGRVAPGVCYRLWTKEEDVALVAHAPPEIESADLAPLVLELAAWGARDPAELTWMTPPPQAALDQARSVLRQIDALDAEDRITAMGREMAAFPLHPRLAHMILASRGGAERALACDIASVLTERDFVRFSQNRERNCDLRVRLDALRGEGAANERVKSAQIDGGALRQVKRVASDLRSRFARSATSTDADAAGRLLALAYPDRVARQRSGPPGRYLLACGRGARVPPHDSLAGSEYLAIASLDGDGTEAGVFIAATVSEDDLRELFASHIQDQTEVYWDSQTKSVAARRRVLFGAVAFEEKVLDDPPSDELTAALMRGIRELGIHVLPWDRDARTWQQRVSFLHGVDPKSWPDVSDDALTQSLENWLAPFASGMKSVTHLKRIDLAGALNSLVGWERARTLETLVPTHADVPSGARIRIDYSGERPALPVQIQKMFGTSETPRIAGGRIALLLHLLSPAQRPVQVTDDLASFWKNAYPELRKELRGRYPKHEWPDDPGNAKPTNRTKRR